MAGYPCCCQSCIIFVDTFDRPDSNELGDYWKDNGTEFKIEDNTAKPNFSFSRAILDIPHPVPDESMVVTLTTINEVDNSGTKYRLILNSQSTANPVNYYFADFIRNGINTSIIKLGICSGNVETILAEDVVLGLVSDSRIFEARIADKEFCATVSRSTLSYVGTVPPALFDNGYYSGMAVYSSAAIVDNFTFSEHYQTNQDCPYCICLCEGIYLPPVLRVTIESERVGDPNNPEVCKRLDLLEPCTFLIFWDRVSSVWRGSDTCCENPSYLSGQLWDISVTCPSNGDPYDMGMLIIQGCTNSCNGCQLGQSPISATCDPFELVYGPFQVTVLDLGCFCSSSSDIFSRGNCNYRIRITLP